MFYQLSRRRRGRSLLPSSTNRRIIRWWYFVAGLLIKRRCTKPPGRSVRATVFYGYCIQAQNQQVFIRVLFEVVACTLRGHGFPHNYQVSRVWGQWYRPFAAFFTVRTQLGCGFRESGALSGTSQPAAWRSRPIVGYFGKEEHFSLMAAGAGGEIDAR